MNNNKKKSGFFNTTSLGAAALTLSFAAQVFAPVNAAIAVDPQPAPAIGQEERPQDVLTKFVQHAMSGRIGMMELEEKMAFFNLTAKKLGLPLINETISPIGFIGVGKPDVGYNMVRRMMNKGYFFNLSVFPSVSYNNTGLRIPVNRLNTF